MDHRIVVQGAREHNLKNVSVALPKDKLVVFTGPSGSGKSSLAFDTIFAEGQRRYVQSLSAYARQFLGVLNKPDVDDISGLSPAVSIEQKGISHNPRSTVGTVTEIYDYLRLLFSRVGTPHCPICGELVHRYSLDEILLLALRDFDGKRVEILAPLVRGKKGEHRNVLDEARREGFLRVRVDGRVLWLEEEISLDKNRKHSIEIVVDRLTLTEENRDRLSESTETALRLGGGYVLFAAGDDEERLFSENFACPRCEISLPEIEPRLFSFNSPFGACQACSGLGSHEHFSFDLAVDPERSVWEGAILPWKTNHYMLRKLKSVAESKSWDLSLPFRDLSPVIRDSILSGVLDRVPMTYRENGAEQSYMGRFEGLMPWLENRWTETESESVTEELLSFRTEDICGECLGRRLRPEALAVRIDGLGIADVTEMPVASLLDRIDNLNLSPSSVEISRQILDELRKRLSFMVDVGVGYLTLSRRSDSLSGGESQRIRLATQIGSKLSGVLYVLDEPTIGLHPRDTDKLLKTLKTVRDLGNTVLVVEHDRDTMLAADYILELGPGAGEHGGNVVAAGTQDSVCKTDCLTGPYLKGTAFGAVLREKPRSPEGWLEVTGAREHNLKDIDVLLPLGVLTCITGVSGSGKSTLMHDILYRGLKRLMDRDFRGRAGQHEAIRGWNGIRNVVLVDQNPIGRTPRSNPATYTGLFTPVRELFSQLPEAKIRGFQPGRFSFNVRGGRCEACKGEGESRISMLFMPDVFVPCEICKGKRYNHETLEVRYKGKTIADILDMPVEEALGFFADIPRIASKLRVIEEAGLGYIRLGQPAPTLSGGEAQRVKLATELSKRFSGPTLYLLDEPTTGLHYTDVNKLLLLLHRLVDQGNTVVMIEHNLDVLASSDFLVDLGPEGGDGGGRVVTTGSPEEVSRKRSGYTAPCLREYLKQIRRVAHA
ncbi:MAG: excinuclease ABC subunit UvrA [Synergistales bacterium]